MKSLFNENYRHTTDANNLTFETERAVRKTFQAYVEKGYSPREIAEVMKAEIDRMMLLRIL